MARTIAPTYAQLLRMHFRAFAATPQQLLVGSASTVLDIGVSLLLILVVFGSNRAIAGWSADEALLLYGFWLIGTALYHTFLNGIQDVPNHIMTGRLDSYLTKPLPPVVVLVGVKISIYGLPELLFGAAVLVGAIARLHDVIALERLLLLPLLIAASVVLNFAIQLALASLSLWRGPMRSLSQIHSQVAYLLSVPLDVYGPVIRQALATTPLAIISYVPSRWLLGRASGQELALQLGLVGAVVLGAAWLWTRGLRHYESTGSAREAA